MWRNQNGHVKLAMLMCAALEFDSHCFKFLPLLQGMNQLKSSRGKRLHHSLSRPGDSSVDDVPGMPLGGDKPSSAPELGSPQLARACG